MEALILIAIIIAIYVAFELFDIGVKKALGYAKKPKSVPTENRS